MRAQLADGRILEFPDGTDPAVIQATVKKLLAQGQPYQPGTGYASPSGAAISAAKEAISPSNITGAASEPILSMATGALGSIVGGAAGLGTMATNALGFTHDNPEDVVKYWQDKLTYQPRTEGGQTALQTLTYPFQKWGELSNYAGKSVNDTLNYIHAPKEVSAGVGAVTNALYQAIPMLIGVKGISGEPAMPALEKAIKTVKKPATIVKETVQRHLPGGTEKAVATALEDISGKYKPNIIKSLKKADTSETAGQAATSAGSYEFSALQKFAESKDPSGYGAIHDAQQVARIKAIQDALAKNKGALSAAKKSRKIVTEPHYTAAEASQTPVNPSPVLDKINATIKKNINENSITRPLISIKRKLEPGGQLETNPNNLISLSNHIRDMLNKTVDGKNIYNTKVLTDIKTQLDNLISQQVPDYGVARSTYADMSSPINQMKVGQALIDVLKPRLGSTERATQFANTMANVDKLVKKETGQRATLGNTLTPRQMDVVNSVMDQLNRNKEMSYQASKGAKSLNEKIGTLHELPRIGILERSVVILNAILKRIEGKGSQAIYGRLTELMKPENRAELINILQKASADEKAALIKDPAIASILAGQAEQSNKR